MWRFPVDVSCAFPGCAVTLRRRLRPAGLSQFPPVVIQPAIWLYVRFTLSYRDAEELLAERGLDVSSETIWRWVLKFGPSIARGLRRRRP